MFAPVLSGLVVSTDAFFIGASLGLQKKCKFYQIALINLFLCSLCMVGYFLADFIADYIFFDTAVIVGLVFISLGAWYIFGVSKISIVGVAMSVEAMFITMGLTLLFSHDNNASIIIPIAVALAHFGYAAASFFLARSRLIRRISDRLCNIISGGALIIYGLMALIF